MSEATLGNLPVLLVGSTLKQWLGGIGKEPGEREAFLDLRYINLLEVEYKHGMIRS